MPCGDCGTAWGPRGASVVDPKLDILRTKRSGPSSPPMRIDGMRPAFAASYNHERETPSCAATSDGFRRASCVCGDVGLMWLLTGYGMDRPSSCGEYRQTDK